MTLTEVARTYATIGALAVCEHCPTRYGVFAISENETVLFEIGGKRRAWGCTYYSGAYIVCPLCISALKVYAENAARTEGGGMIALNTDISAGYRWN